MRTKSHLCLAVMSLCLFAARAEAREFTFDFSAQRIDGASVTGHAFEIGDTINLSLPEGQPSFALQIVAAPPAGIAGPSYIAKDLHGQASAVVKPTSPNPRSSVRMKTMFGFVRPSAASGAAVRATVRAMIPTNFFMAQFYHNAFRKQQGEVLRHRMAGVEPVAARLPVLGSLPSFATPSSTYRLAWLMPGVP